MFSKSCEYGLRAMIFIAKESNQGINVGLQTITNAIDSPAAFTAKVLQQLTRNKLIKSIKGPNGGFMIEPLRMKTPLSEIVRVLDGDKIYTGCGLGLKECNSKSPCPLHHEFVAVRSRLKELLEKNTLERFLVNNETQAIVLKR